MKTKAGNLNSQRDATPRFSKVQLSVRVIWLFILFACLASISMPQQVFAQIGLPSVCVPPGGESYESGFSEDNFTELNNVGIGDSGDNLYLETGRSIVNPNNIIIPFTQNVSVTFLYEGAGYKSHFGWFVAEYDVDKINNTTGEAGSDDITDTYGIHVGNFIPSYVYDSENDTYETRYYIDPNMMDLDSDDIPDDRIFWAPNSTSAWGYGSANVTARANEVKERICSSATYDEPVVYAQFSGDPKNTFYLLYQSINDTDSSYGGDGILDPPSGCSFSSEDNVASCVDTMTLLDPATSTYKTIYLGAGPETNPTDRGRFIVDGDGTLTSKDMRKNLGTIQAGTEVVFFLVANGDYKQTFYSKRDFNGDSWASTNGTWYFGNPDNCTQGSSMNYTQKSSYTTSGNPFVKNYYTGRALQVEGYLIQNGCWMTGDSATKLNDLFGISFDYNEVKTITLYYTTNNPWEDFSATDVSGNFSLEGYNKFFQHLVESAPQDNPYLWVLGWEDLYNGGDTDHNDLVFIANRITGGNADSTIVSEALIPEEGGDEDVTIATITFTASDYVPEHTQITYYFSIDNGANWYILAQSTPEPDPTDQDAWLAWIDLMNWDTVERTSGEGRYYNDRNITISVSDLGITGYELRWKAEMSSDDDNYAPEISDVSISYTAIGHGFFGRNSPMTLGNVLYYGEYETPESTWDDTRYRGHFKAFEIYDPAAPDGGVTNTFLWDTGEMLQAISPDSRNIYVSDLDIESVPSSSGDPLEQLDVGDGSTSEFSGTTDYSNVVPYTFKVYTQISSVDVNLTDDGYGNLYSANPENWGTLDRFTGEYYLHFSDNILSGIPIRASYDYYTYTNTLISFDTVDAEAFALDPLDQYIDRFGNQYYHYDFNGDDAVTDSDAEYLKSWVRGWEDGSEASERWMLGPIDHSVAAIIHPPGLPDWFFGTDISDDELISFWNWIYEPEQSSRRTIAYVGARDGMIHAIDAGAFKQGDNPGTDFLEYRGYFQWDETGTPDYGTGQELWAFIPNNLISKLKNNYLREDNQAYVDASPSVSDISIGSNWYTILVCAQGNGGNNVFALDITDPTPGSVRFLWEFGDPAIYRSRSSPSIGRIYLDGQLVWITCFSAGQNQNSDEYGQVFILNAEDGSIIKRVYLNAVDDSDHLGNTPSGNPVLLDTDNNGYLDRIYIGDDKGIVHRINIGSSVSQIIDYALADVGQPIYGSLAVRLNKGTRMAEIFFGTGDSPLVAGDIPSGEIYYFYAFRDPYGVGEVIDSPYDTEFVDPEAEPEERVGLIWKMSLDPGQRVWASAFSAAEQVYFGTSASDTEDPCAPSVDPTGAYGSIYSVDAVDGTLTNAEEVGNVIANPIVWDEHLYFRTSASSTTDPHTNSVSGRGDPNSFNNPLRGSYNIKYAGSWREIL